MYTYQKLTKQIFVPLEVRRPQKKRGQHQRTLHTFGVSCSDATHSNKMNTYFRHSKQSIPQELILNGRQLDVQPTDSSERMQDVAVWKVVGETA